MECCIAGDIKGIEQLAGHAGASATYNCIICEARLHQTYVAGVPHLRESFLSRGHPPTSGHRRSSTRLLGAALSVAITPCCPQVIHDRRIKVL